MQCTILTQRHRVSLQSRPLHRTAGRRALRVHAVREYDQLRDLTVYRAGSGEPVELLSLWQARPGSKVVMPFLTHFADLTSWEYAQKLVKIMPMLEASGVQVIAVGLGSAANAQEFARDLRFPATKLFADPSGAAYKALGFNPGFLPDLDISPYAKLLPMLAGVGSEGTLQEVVRGYIGDRAAQPVFDRATPFDILGTGYQRPFELATLRLFNMVGVLSRWNVLSPPNQALLTQQGGTLAFDGQDVIFKHVDSGILKYTDTEALLRVVLNADIVADAQVLPAITDV
ncbi:AhpC/TSA antioxidant enzyme-domain-containing protein [Haematococcus lacustris]